MNRRPARLNTREQAAPDGLRLSLDAAIPQGAGLNGGWWPYSRDAGAELPGLIAELNTRAGRVSRVALQADAFSNIPHLLRAGGHKVHVAWFRYMNTHTISLTMADGYRLTLLWSRPGRARRPGHRRSAWPPPAATPGRRRPS